MSNFVLERFKRDEIKLDDFVREYSGIKWGVCDWGSCQYSFAMAVFTTMQQLKEAGDDPFLITMFLTTKFNHYMSRATKKVIDKALQSMKEYMLNMMKHVQQYEDDVEEIEQKKKLIDDIRDFDEMFMCCKNECFDLWTTASKACEFIFGTDFEDTLHSGNLLLGIQCFLLVECGAIKDSDTSFSSFDT